MLVPDTQGDGPNTGEKLPTLYYSPFSLYSILTRFAFELGSSFHPETAPTVRLRLINLQGEQNLTEEYLSISPKGQVPVFSCISKSGEPQLLEESRAILSWLCDVQTELLPEEHREEIHFLMNAFFAFHAKPLTARADEQNGGISNKAAAMLERTDITDSHRRRLEVKSVFHDTIHGGSLEPDNIEEVEASARSFFESLSETIQKYSQNANADDSKYIFGKSPTIVDAVATSLLARMLDIKRTDLINDTLKEYASRLMATTEWKRTTLGRPTLYDPALGKVEDMKLFEEDG